MFGEVIIFISKMKCETKFGINSTGNGITICTKCNFQNGNVSPRAFLADKDLDGIEGYLSFSHWPSKNICLKFVFYQEILPFVVLVYVQRRDPPSPQGSTSISIFREIKSIFFLPPQQTVAKIHLNM